MTSAMLRRTRARGATDPGRTETYTQIRDRMYSEYPTDPETLVFLETQFPQDVPEGYLYDDAMLDAIDELPYELRMVVEARVYGKETWWAIGEAQGYSRFTAKARWLEALLILREQA